MCRLYYLDYSYLDLFNETRVGDLCRKIACDVTLKSYFIVET